MSERKCARVSSLAVRLALIAGLAAAVCAPAARAAELGGIQGRLGETLETGDTAVGALSVVIEPEAPPAWLTFIGDDLHFEATLGVFKDARVDDNNVAFAHFGPVWHYEPGLIGPLGFVEVGIAPTYLSEDELDGDDVGGQLHFTTHAMLGLELGARRGWHLGLRAQHTSNAGLENDNPGIEALMLEVGYRFGRR